METGKAGDVIIFRCRGPIVFGEEASELHVLVRAALAETGKVVLALGGVTYLDSAGIGTLFGIYTSSITHRGRLRLACLTPRVRQTLEMSKLLDLVEVSESEEDALRALAETAAN